MSEHDDIVSGVAEALLSHEWDPAVGAPSAHRNHTLMKVCAICAGDMRRISAIAIDEMAAQLASRSGE